MVKRSTEVSGNQTPEACSLIQVSARARGMPVTVLPGANLREASQNYTELSHSNSTISDNFSKKDLTLTPRPLQIRPILPLLGHILSHQLI